MPRVSRESATGGDDYGPVEGRAVFRYADGEEVFVAGDASTRPQGTSQSSMSREPRS